MNRFWSKVQKSDACWTWTGSRNSDGYGTFGVDGRVVMAHRLAYELLVGEIRLGYEIDHLCRNRACVNPDHLEPVTHAENLRRAWAAVDRSTCRRGHEMNHANTYVSADGNRRACRACNALAVKTYRSNNTLKGNIA